MENAYFFYCGKSTFHCVLLSFLSALDRSSLICIAFVTGSDYTEGIQGVFVCWDLFLFGFMASFMTESPEINVAICMLYFVKVMNFPVKSKRKPTVCKLRIRISGQVIFWPRLANCLSSWWEGLWGYLITFIVYISYIWDDFEDRHSVGGLVNVAEQSRNNNYFLLLYKLECFYGISTTEKNRTSTTREKLR